LVDLSHIPKSSGIYKITCNPNKRVYVGSSVNLRARLHQHIHFLLKGKHHNVHLQRAFNKYGIDNFTFSVIEECEVDRLLEREEYYINKYSSLHNDKGFNIVATPTDGGVGKTVSEETKRKLSDRFSGEGNPNYGKCLSEETKEKIRQAHLGKEVSEETREKLRLIKTGKKRPEWVTKKILESWERNNSHPTKGKKMSEETRRKISENNHMKKHGHTEESKMKIGLASRGSKNGNSKLTEEDVVMIKLLLNSGKVTQSSIAKLYGVNPTLILNIKKGKKWSHVEVTGNESTEELHDLIEKCINISKETKENAIKSNSDKHRGENGSKSKLKEEDVVNIKRMFKEGKTAKEISELYGVSLSALYSIKHGRNWSHVVNDEVANNNIADIC